MNIGKIDVATGEMRVIYSQPQGTNGSLVTTAGGLVFFGDLNRRVRALDADDGKVLWESVVGGMVMVSTVTYAVNGKQYVMVFTGEGQSLTNNVLALTEGRDAEPRARQRHLCLCVAVRALAFALRVACWRRAQARRRWRARRAPVR